MGSSLLRIYELFFFLTSRNSFIFRREQIFFDPLNLKNLFFYNPLIFLCEIDEKASSAGCSSLFFYVLSLLLLGQMIIFR